MDAVRAVRIRVTLEIPKEFLGPVLKSSNPWATLTALLTGVLAEFKIRVVAVNRRDLARLKGVK